MSIVAVTKNQDQTYFRCNAYQIFEVSLSFLLMLKSFHFNYWRLSPGTVLAKLLISIYTTTDINKTKPKQNKTTLAFYTAMNSPPTP